MPRLHQTVACERFAEAEEIVKHLVYDRTQHKWILAAGALLVWGEWKAHFGQQNAKARKLGGKMEYIKLKEKLFSWADQVLKLVRKIKGDRIIFFF